MEIREELSDPNAFGRDLSGLEPANEKDVVVRVYQAPGKCLGCVAMPPDGSFVLTGGEEGTVRKWALDESSPSEIVCRAKGFWALAVSGNGRFVAAGDSLGSIHVVELSAGYPKQKWRAHQDHIGSLFFLDGGRELLSASVDGSIRRWDSKTEAKIAEWKLAASREGCAVASSENGRRMIGVTPRGMFFLDGANRVGGTPLAESIGDFQPICMAPDGRYAFVGTPNGVVAKWDLTQLRRVASFEGHSNAVSAVAVTPDGRFCVSGDFDGSVFLWVVETGQCLAILHGHTNVISDIAVSANGSRIASVGNINDCSLRIWDIPESILARAKYSAKRGYMNAKVVLLGDSGVGKSGLALRLWHDRWEKTESSHGMEIQRLALPAAERDDGVVREVWLWDLAGQPDYRLTHQLFMEQTALALLVFDPQGEKIYDTVGYWQRALGKVVREGNVKGVLVAARCDRPGLRLTLDEVREWAAARGLQGPILTAAKLKKHSGAAELRDLIARLLPWDTMEFRSTMENFPALKEAILAARDGRGLGGVVVKPAELEARVRKVAKTLVFTPEDLRAVTGLLAGEGVLHALPYGDLVVLQPSWVNCYASTLVKLAGEANNQLGHVPLATIQPGQLPGDGTPRLSFEDERQLLPALVALFLERALAWTQNTDKGEMLVFPNYVRLPRPTPPPRPGRTVLYRFTGPLEEIYCTLVVRLRYSGIFSGTKLYRQAVDFSTATGKLAALTMKEEGERGELEIYFGAGLDPDVQAPFQRFVHDHLKAKAANLERLRNYFCSKCGHEAKDRETVDALIADGITEMPCQRCFTIKKGVIVLSDVLEKQFAANKGEKAATEAGLKAGEGISTASMEQVMVGEVTTLVASVDQAFIPRVVRDEGTDGEIEFFTKARESTGVAFRVQLKSGNSHLKKLKDSSEKFPMKPHYERYWAGPKTVPVLLIIRTSDGSTRFINATEAIQAVQKAKPGKPVRQIPFVGEAFTKESVLRLRDERLQ
jgi:small GTP-binding protein